MDWDESLNGEIMDVRYADDQARMASGEVDLQELVSTVGRIAGQYRMKININKNNDCDGQRGVC